MKSLLAKIKKVVKAIYYRIKQRGIKGLLIACVNYIKYGKAVIDEYKEWIETNEPNEKELDIERKYQSCQNISFDIVLESEQEGLIKSIKSQTYSKWNILDKKDEEILNSTNSDYIIFLGKNLELASFALYDIVKTKTFGVVLFQWIR